MKNYRSLKISYVNNIHNVSLVSNNFREVKQDEVLVKIKYSSLNYKDALSITGSTKIIKGDSLIPGLDFSGVVVESSTKKFSKGDKVLATGAGLGETINGGFSEYVYVPYNILVKIPNKLSLLSAMQIGTAGFTAAIAIDKMLLNKQKINSGPILISGATGGVGSIAINILYNLGFEVIAATRKNNSNSYLKKIGSHKVMFLDNNFNKKFLNHKLFAGSIDNVGGNLLDWIIKSTYDNGNIVSVGMASSYNLNTTIFPLIMRGVNILGVSSTNYPNSKRKFVWGKLSEVYKPTKLNIINKKSIELTDIKKYSKILLSGKNTGKVIIKNF